MDEWNGKFYIGKHYGKVDDAYTGSGKLIKEYFSKYGKVLDKTYVKEIIDYGDENSICDLERNYIRKGMESELCLNLHCTSGTGNFGMKHSEEAKQKMRKPKSTEHRKHISEAKKGKVGANKGKTFSEETRRKMKLNHADVLGENNPMYGKKHSEETRRKMIEARKRRYQNKK